MANLNIQVNGVTVVMTGIEFLSYARRFLDAAEALHQDSYKVPYDAVQGHLLCQSLELHLKAFIWLIDRHTRDKFRSKYGQQKTVANAVSQRFLLANFWPTIFRYW